MRVPQPFELRVAESQRQMSPGTLGGTIRSASPVRELIRLPRGGAAPEPAPSDWFTRHSADALNLNNGDPVPTWADLGVHGIDLHDNDLAVYQPNSSRPAVTTEGPAAATFASNAPANPVSFSALTGFWMVHASDFENDQEWVAVWADGDTAFNLNVYRWDGQWWPYNNFNNDSGDPIPITTNPGVLWWRYTPGTSHFDVGFGDATVQSTVLQDAAESWDVQQELIFMSLVQGSYSHDLITYDRALTAGEVQAVIADLSSLYGGAA